MKAAEHRFSFVFIFELPLIQVHILFLFALSVAANQKPKRLSACANRLLG